MPHAPTPYGFFETGRSGGKRNAPFSIYTVSTVSASLELNSTYDRQEIYPHALTSKSNKVLQPLNEVRSLLGQISAFRVSNLHGCTYVEKKAKARGAEERGGMEREGVYAPVLYLYY